MESAPLLYATLALYGLGTLVVLGSLVHNVERLRKLAFGLMAAGLVVHTVYIGTICASTGHPPLTNLPETTSFLAWLILVAKFVLDFRFKVRAAAFFVYPLVLMLVVITAAVGEEFVALDPQMRSNLFTAHLLLTTVGIAALFIGLGFLMLYKMQERSLKEKRRGPLWEWIPSLRVCNLLSYRSLTIGFSVYTLGLVAGILWAYRSTVGTISFGAKEIGAIVAWVMFGILLQSYLNGSFRTSRMLVISAIAFVAILVSIFGIQHVGP